MAENIVITISRQYGSGGKTVGEMLSKKLGFHYYDRELMRLASEESGINETLFASVDETVKNNGLFKPSKNIYEGQLISPESDDFTSDDNLFNYQAMIIRKLAEQQSCIIVGRCADFILKDYEKPSP